MNRKPDKLLFGAAYYDEYLPTDRIETDLEMMKRAGMNVIRIAESTWSTWEPQDGVFDFTHLHRMLSCSKKHGIQVIVGTPTYAVPTWLVRKYPDILTETHDGQERYGRRQNMDIAHPMYLKHAERIIRRLMEEVRDYDHVIGFQLDNETKAYDTCSAYAQKKFIAYVRELFHDDLQSLNEAWGLDYWSNRINAWEDFPDVRGTINGSLGAEYQKFQRKLVTDFLAWQSAIVQEYARPDQFITQNFDYDWRGQSFGLQPDVDQWEAARSLTVAGCDIYHPSAQDLTGKEISFGGAIARSLKKDNYLVLETEAQGLHNWLSYPGQLRLQAFSHLANGANCVEYWHWHSIHNAIESYWKGVLSHNLKENATYREACRIGADFAAYGTHLVNLRKHCQTAILLDNESLTALKWFPTGGEGLGYNEIFRHLYDALYEMNVECDILSAESDVDLFSQYKFLITPALYSVSDTLVTALKRYVSSGGVLLSTFRTAVADRMLKIYHDDLPHGLTDVFGMTYDQFTNPVRVGLRAGAETKSTDTATDLTDSVNSSVAETQRHCVHHWMELLLPDTAETLAFYDHPHWGDCAAVTGNRFGKGYAAYLGCYADTDELKKLLSFLCEKAEIVMEEAVYPLVVKRGTNGLQKEIAYYFNYSEEEQTVIYHGPDARLLLAGHETRTQDSVSASSENTAALPENASVGDAPAVIKDGSRLTLTCWDFLILEEF
ncbi:MAG: beta-galactosidase [Bacteroidales bacterium]|nr:beta-galactosidase [Bacteroidales bacterium]MCM1416815.1 beta-galactosidase [bacterium]MCM1422399.1 beta-galactosidase [bacterium]